MIHTAGLNANLMATSFGYRFLTLFSRPIRLHSTKTASTDKLKLYYKMSSHNTALQTSTEEIYFGKEVVNRVSFLREDAEFVSNSVFHPSTRFIFYENGSPLVNKDAEKNRLVILTNGDDQLSTVEGADIAATNKGLVTGDSKWQDILRVWANDNKEQNPGLRDAGKPSFLFLGLKDQSVGIDLQQLKFEDTEKYLDHQGRYSGIPYYGVDLSTSPAVSEEIKNHIVAHLEVAEKLLIYTTSRKHTMTFTQDESALFSHGKMYFDWIARNRFCPGCGSKVIPIHAGGKLRCTNDASVQDGDKTQYECPVKNTSVSNVSFPRSDAVVITAITDQARTKMLLSLNKRHAFTKMYSCTSGFMEPSETVEVATKREIWEETGVVCNDIQILMTQPWPFPANLMIGCVATVEFNGENEVIHLGHDRELADARWFDLSFVRKLANGEHTEATNPEGIVLPTDISVAFSLIKHVLDRADLKL